MISDVCIVFAFILLLYRRTSHFSLLLGDTNAAESDVVVCSLRALLLTDVTIFALEIIILTHRIPSIHTIYVHTSTARSPRSVRVLFTPNYTTRNSFTYTLHINICTYMWRFKNIYKRVCV